MGAAALYSAIAELNPIRVYAPPGVTASGWTDTGSDAVDLTHANDPVINQPGPIGGMLSVLYSGETDRTSGNSFSLAEQQSIVFVYKTPSAENPAGYEFVYSNQEDQDNRTLGTFIASTGVLRFTHKYTADDLSVDLGDHYDGEWKMAGASFDHNTSSAIGYINGSATGSAGTNDFGGSTGALVLGAQTTASANDFNGNIAVFAVFNAALTATQHAGLYEAYKSVTGWRGWRGW